MHLDFFWQSPCWAIAVSTILRSSSHFAYVRVTWLVVAEPHWVPNPQLVHTHTRAFTHAHIHVHARTCTQELRLF